MTSEPDQSANSREALRRARRVVVKIGTAALTRQSGRFHQEHFHALGEDLLHIAKERELIVVSSGAVALGVERLGLSGRPKDIPGKQACAAVGQSRLMRAYEETFEAQGRRVAQVLLTHTDVEDRRRYRNAQHTFERLLSLGVIPIINENDTVSIDELKFGDNDTLAGLVAPLCGAEALVLLSDVEGLYTKDPREDSSAQLLTEVKELTPALFASATGSGSTVGMGGMATKLRAAARATESGIPCVITAGVPGRLREVLAGEVRGTYFHPRTDRRSARTAWIAHALRAKGTLRVDGGAKDALLLRKKSLLPSGIVQVDGDFSEGDAVELADAQGQIFARGLVLYDSNELRQIAGHQSADIESILGYRYVDEVVNRDDLALMNESTSRA